MERKMQNLLEIQNLCVEIPRQDGAVRLVEGIDLKIGRRQSFGIVGESGCGKSVTASAILQLLPYPLRIAQGSIRFDSLAGEVDLLKADAKYMQRLRGQEIAMIFQEPMTSLDPIFTIEQQMFEALDFHHPEMRDKEMRERALAMLRQVNIPRPEQTLRSYPHQLSGGQLQRIMIAIALINKPRLLIADEPTTALDVTIQAQILALMNELKETNDTSIIMITHDLGVIAETCEEVAVFYAGQIVEQASVAELFHHPLHPYTQGLLRSVTSMDATTAKLYSIPGMVPAAGQWSAGCRFANRCAACTQRCHEQAPPLVEIAPGHLCRCALRQEEVGHV